MLTPEVRLKHDILKEQFILDGRGILLLISVLSSLKRKYEAIHFLQPDLDDDSLTWAINTLFEEEQNK